MNSDTASHDIDPNYPLTAGLGEIPIEAVLTEILLADRRASIGVIDEHGTIKMMNKFAALPYGVDSPDELFGKKITKIANQVWVKEFMTFVQRSIDEDKRVVILLISGGFRIRTLIVPIRTDPSDERASSVLVMSEEIKAMIYDRVVSSSRNDEIVVHSDLVAFGPLDVLSTRELEVLALMRQGLRTKDIAAELNRSLSTIERHRESMGRKLELADRSKIIALADIAVLQVEDASRTRLEQ